MTEISRLKNMLREKGIPIKHSKSWLGECIYYNYKRSDMNKFICTPSTVPGLLECNGQLICEVFNLGDFTKDVLLTAEQAYAIIAADYEFVTAIEDVRKEVLRELRKEIFRKEQIHGDIQKM